MQHLLNDLDGIVWTFDAAAAAFTYVSDGSRRLLGYEPREWLDDPGFRTRLLHPEDRQRVLDAFARATTAGGSFDLTYRLRAADGGVALAPRHRPCPDRRGRRRHEPPRAARRGRRTRAARVRRAVPPRRRASPRDRLHRGAARRRHRRAHALREPAGRRRAGVRAGRVARRSDRLGQAAAPGGSRSDPRDVRADRDHRRALPRGVSDVRARRIDPLGPRRGHRRPGRCRRRRCTGRASCST